MDENPTPEQVAHALGQHIKAQDSAHAPWSPAEYVLYLALIPATAALLLLAPTMALLGLT